MKTAAIPTPLDNPEPHHAINERQTRQAFLARALASRDEAQRSGEYYSAASVMQELAAMQNEAGT